MTPDTPVHLLEAQRQKIRALMHGLGFAEDFTTAIVEKTNRANVDEVLALLELWKSETNT